jgi:hypothetical protein
MPTPSSSISTPITVGGRTLLLTSVDGVLEAKQEKKADATDAFYFNLLGTAPEREFSLDLDFLGVQSHDLSELDRSFTEEEVWAVVR